MMKRFNLMFEKLEEVVIQKVLYCLSSVHTDFVKLF